MPDTQIMIVEDEKIVAWDIKRVLVESGYDVSATVGTGEEAIQHAEKVHPDLILMDIHLRGEMDGFEAADHIQTRFDIPVVYLTGNMDEERLNRAKGMHSFACVPKPFNKYELQTNIEKVLCS